MAGISRNEVVIVGMINKIEIWGKEKWDECIKEYRKFGKTRNRMIGCLN
ncbi:MAG: division/cell wall cluster transcriptional repressor MraZ [Candidatus Desulfofervidus auxilii]|nr:division/cell wall cluster transcriptional repressor MraZ [Candidatus Desulfofervidus auxilii]